jgi:dephospho-CoA kinase
MGCGKGRASAYLIKKYGATRFRSSDPLRTALTDIFGIPQSRENMAKLSTFLRSTYGEGAIAYAVAELVKKSTADVCIFDGMRRDIDAETFKKFENFTLVFIETDEKIRYERYIKRNENPGDADMSYDEFLRRSNAEPEQEIDLLKEQADVVVKNNGTIEEFNQSIEEIFQKIQK